MEYYSGSIPRKTGSLISKELPADGNRSWSIIENPTIEPVTVDELKFFSRITTNAEDSFLESSIKSAREAAELYTGRSFIKQKIRMLMDFWPGLEIKLPRPPLISVSKVFTIDEDDTETTYSSSSYYVITTGTPGKVVIKRSVTPPTNTNRDYGGFGIDYYSGYGSNPSDVPLNIREAIKLWAARVYAMRTIDPKNPPPEVAEKLRMHKTRSTTIR